MAYTSTVTSPMKSAERISRSFGFYSGKCDVSLYDTTLLEITGITKYFATGGQSGWTKGLVAVIPTGVSDNGHVMEWDYTTGAFKAYKPSNLVISGSLTGAAMTYKAGGIQGLSTGGSVVAAATEAAAVDVGSVGFIAIGFLKG